MMNNKIKEVRIDEKLESFIQMLSKKYGFTRPQIMRGLMRKSQKIYESDDLELPNEDFELFLRGQ